MFCRYCAQTGDTMEGIAALFGTDWLQLMGANTHLEDPNALTYLQVLNKSLS